MVVNPASRNVAQVSWTVGKAGLFGIPTGGTYQGTLNANGGSIVFDAPGTYTLTATAKSSAGETVTVSQDIEILPVGKFGFGLPKTAYTDTVVDVEVLGGVEGSVTWRVQKDGQETPLANAFAGTLTDTGGFITFREEGIYTLTGQIDGGKSYGADITVYPLMKIPFTVPATTYRNTEISANGCRRLDLLCQPGGLSDHRQRSGYLYRPGIFPNQADPGCQPAAQCTGGYSRRYRAAQQRQGAGGICSYGH